MIKQLNEIDKNESGESNQKPEAILILLSIALLSKEKPLTIKILEFLNKYNKLLISTILGILTIVVSFNGNAISERQNKILTAQLQLLDKQTNQNIDMKLMEIVIQSLVNDDSKIQKAGISLVDKIESLKIRSYIHEWLDQFASEELKPKVDKLESYIERRQLEMVNKYDIQIFYNRGNNREKNRAEDIKGELEKVGVTSTIQVKQHGGQYTLPNSDEIRYYPLDERDVADALQLILGDIYSEKSFNLRPVNTPTPGSVSIFLKTDS